MDYGMIGQIAKAKYYAEERHRIRFVNFTVTMEGNNNTHIITFDGSAWHDDTSFFQAHGWSSHTVALERILKGMIAEVPTSNGKEPAAQSSIISQIEKAKQYTDEPHRVKFLRFTAIFSGENHEHTVNYDGGKWDCDCRFFHTHNWCSHVVALERILGQMVMPATHEPH